VVDRLDEAELTGGIAIALEMQTIHVSRNAAHRPAILQSKKQLGLGMLEEGIALGTKVNAALQI
jgi:hypothetical protein